MGVEISNEANMDRSKRGKTNLISTQNSKVKVIVLPTNEELVIAQDTQSIIEKLLN